MKWLTMMLEMLGIVSALAGMIFILLITYAVVKKQLPKFPSRQKTEQVKEERRT